MSLIDAPLAAVDRLLRRPPAVPPDDPVVRHIDRVVALLEPEHRFRDRLRGIVLNHYVGEIEGLMRRQPPRREMGRLGRAVLYASFALAIGVTGTGAASQHALPGDLLYPIKLEVEELRMRVAPEAVRPHLLAVELAERLEELEALAAGGRWDLVHAATERVVEVGDELEAVGVAMTDIDAELIEHRLEVLEDAVALAPASARAGLLRAISTGDAVTRDSSAGSGVDSRGPAGDGDADGGPGPALPGGQDVPGGGQRLNPSPRATPKERSTPQPQSSPPGAPLHQPTPAPTPAWTPEPDASGEIDSTSDPTPTPKPMPKPKQNHGTGGGQSSD